jgi:hypothetical protein
MSKGFLIASLAIIMGTGFSGVAMADYRAMEESEMEQNGVDPNGCYQSGPCVCYCPVTRYKKEEYCVQKCVKEPYVCRKKCCRYVDQCYTKTRCRYVPQYYEEKCTRKVPEYYYTCEEKCKDKYVTEKRCRYVPYTCMEKKCVPCGQMDNCDNN